MAAVKKIVTLTNTVFMNCEDSHEELIKNSIFESADKKENKISTLKKALENVENNGLKSSSLQMDDRYFHIATLDSGNFKRTENDKLIFEINYFYDLVLKHGNDGEEKKEKIKKYYISTGLYCGEVSLGKNQPKLVIKTGYSDVFFKRILNYCCGLYADITDITKASVESSIYELLIQYLFLISLRRAMNKAIPKKYVYLEGRGYEIKGEVDIEKYINNDLNLFDKKISYKYAQRLEIQSIIDVLYTAIKYCNIKNNVTDLPQFVNFRNYINNLYSGVRPTKKVVNNILFEKCLSNSLYQDYKKPLEYAKIIINKNDVNSNEHGNSQSFGCFLVDSSFLWEMYLYNLLQLHLKNWEIQSQAEMSFYENTFYSKNNYPDLVLRNRHDGRVFVLDAKFKKMEYNNIDIDNADIRQLHSYSYYYQLKEKDNFKGAALIYPTKIDKPDNINNIDDIFGVADSGKKFGVFAIKDPSDTGNMLENEMLFINELKKFLEDYD